LIYKAFFLIDERNVQRTMAILHCTIYIDI